MLQSSINAIINQILSTVAFAVNWGITVIVIATAAMLVVSLIAYLFTASK